MVKGEHMCGIGICGYVWAYVDMCVVNGGICVLKGGHMCGKGWAHMWQRVGTCVAKGGHVCRKGWARVW